jgi:hypothetical protein
VTVTRICTLCLRIPPIIKAPERLTKKMDRPRTSGQMPQTPPDA